MSIEDIQVKQKHTADMTREANRAALKTVCPTWLE